MTQTLLKRRRQLIRGLIRLLAFRVVARARLEGVGHLSRRGPLILIVNHSNAFDPILVMGALTERFAIPLSKSENLRHPLYGWLLRLYAPIPLHRDAIDRPALAAALHLLQGGGALIVAPEGTRSPALRRGRTGLAYLALKSGAPILPVGISGMQHWPRIFRGRRARVTVRFGASFRVRPSAISQTGPPRRALLRQITDESMYQLARLVEPELRGEYANLAQATTETLELTTTKGAPCAAS